MAVQPFLTTPHWLCGLGDAGLWSRGSSPGTGLASPWPSVLGTMICLLPRPRPLPSHQGPACPLSTALSGPGCGTSSTTSHPSASHCPVTLRGLRCLQPRNVSKRLSLGKAGSGAGSAGGRPRTCWAHRKEVSAAPSACQVLGWAGNGRSPGGVSATDGPRSMTGGVLGVLRMPST